MTRTDLIEDLARTLRVPHTQAKAVLEAILDGMVRALRRGERVELRRFGTFSTHLRGARDGRNPATGQRLRVPEKRVLSFRPAGELRAVVNRPPDPGRRRAGGEAGQPK